MSHSMSFVRRERNDILTVKGGFAEKGLTQSKLADFYEVDIRELIGGERKSENMNESLKETLVTVADYSKKTNDKRLASVYGRRKGGGSIIRRKRWYVLLQI